YALMDGGKIRQLTGGSNPDIEMPARDFFAEIALEFDRTQFDRPIALVVSANRVRHRRQQLLAHVGIAWKFFGWRYVRHLGLVVKAWLIGVKRDQHGKKRMAMLPRGDATGGEAFAVTDTVYVVDDRNFWIARQQEVGMHRGGRSAGINSAHSRDKGFPDDLAAKDTLPADLRRAAAEQVHFERFEVEDIAQVWQGGGHEEARTGQRVPSPCYAAAGFTRNAR